MIQVIFEKFFLSQNLNFIFSDTITFKEVSGESKKVTKEMSASWEETILPTIFSWYQLHDADGFRLFYKALPLFLRATLLK